MSDWDFGSIRHGIFIPVQFLVFEWLWWFAPAAAVVLALSWYGLKRAKRGLRRR